MPRLVNRPPFNPAAETVVRKKLTANGRHYQPGDVFLWRHAAIDKRRVRLMFDSGLLAQPNAQPLQPRPAKVFAVAPNETFEPPADLPPLHPIHGLSMPELREIAEEEGATGRRSKEDLIASILDNRSKG